MISHLQKSIKNVFLKHPILYQDGIAGDSFFTIILKEHFSWSVGQFLLEIYPKDHGFQILVHKTVKKKYHLWEPCINIRNIYL